MRLVHQAWRDIRHGEHIDLYVTIVTAIVLVALDILGIDVSTLMAPITIAVLGLLAMNLLNTRHHIDQQLQSITGSATTGLRGRTALPSFREDGRTASEIALCGVSLITAIIPNLEFFEQKLQQGCHLRFLLLDPNSQAMQTWNLMSPVPNIQRDIEQVLNALAVLMRQGKGGSGICEVYLAPVYLPFGMAIFDPKKEEGFMNVEMVAYQRHPGDRPHVLLNRSRDQKWFAFFHDQYERLWADSVAWQPPSV